MSKYKQLIKNVLLFCLNSLLPKLILFFLIPIYTKALTTEEYGILDLIINTSMLIIPIITLNISDAFLRFLLDKNSNTSEIVNICYRIYKYTVLISVSLFIILNIFNPFGIDVIYYLYFSLYLIINILYSLVSVYLKGIEKINILVRGSIINSIITFVATITLISLFKFGVIGFVIGTLLGPLVGEIYMIVSCKLYKVIKNKNINKQLKKDMIKYGVPMIFSAIAWWINNSSDKYILTLFSGVSISGLYAISSKIPHILKNLQNVFLQAWSISAIKEFDKNDSDGFIGNMFSIMCFGTTIICSFLLIINIFISKIFYSGDFYSAWKYVPFLLLSVVFDSLALFIGNLFFAVKDTKTLSLCNIIGAIVNIGLNLLLIPRFDAYGAAIATLISYFIIYLLSCILIKKYIKMKINKINIISNHILLIIQMILAVFGNKYLIIQLVILLMLLIINHRLLFSFKKIIVNKFKLRGGLNENSAKSNK